MRGVVLSRPPRTKAAQGLVLNGTGAVGQYAACPDLDIGTTDLDLRVLCIFNAWPVAALTRVASKWDAVAGKNTFFFSAQVDQRLAFGWSADGTNQTNNYISTANAPVTAGTPIWVRVTFDAQDGTNHAAGKFYTSSDGSAWTQLGTTQASNANSSLFDGTGKLEAGAVSLGTNVLNGCIQKLDVRNNINDDGTGKVATPDFLAQKQHTRQFLDAQGNVWSLNGRTEIL